MERAAGRAAGRLLDLRIIDDPDWEVVEGDAAWPGLFGAAELDESRFARVAAVAVCRPFRVTTSPRGRAQASMMTATERPLRVLAAAARGRIVYFATDWSWFGDADRRGRSRRAPRPTVPWRRTRSSC